jgi:hypothetical protein
MNVKLHSITKEEFENDKSPILFGDNITNNRYALFEGQTHHFRLAWYSELVKPDIFEINQLVYAIGIDQHFAIVNFSTHHVILTLTLSYNFLTTKSFGNWIFVITELEIIRIDKNNLRVVEENALPDLFESMFFKQNEIEVKCAENIIITIPI